VHRGVVLTVKLILGLVVLAPPVIVAFTLAAGDGDVSRRRLGMVHP
jgi:hypothetical protein